MNATTTVECPVCEDNTVEVKGQYHEGYPDTFYEPGEPPHIEDWEVSEYTCNCRENLEGILTSTNLSLDEQKMVLREYDDRVDMKIEDLLISDWTLPDLDSDFEPDYDSDYRF